MKKTLFLLAAALCGTASAALEVGDIVGVTFLGTNGTAGSVAGSLFGTSGQINHVKTSASDLVDLTGANTGLSLSSGNSSNCGNAGIVNSRLEAAVGAAPTTIFDGASITGDYKGGCLNAHTPESPMTMTLSGLTAGQTYDMFLLVGRGNNYANGSADTPVTYTLSGAESIDCTLVGASSTSSTASGSVLTSYEFNATNSQDSPSAWALAKYSFTATGDSVTITTNAGGNINALALQVTPEPTTATLSLLALAGLCARRRRK